jgi:hypothetical protein
MVDQPQVSLFVPPKPANPQPAAPVHHTSHVRDARIVDGTRSNPPMSEPERRWKADFDEITRSDPWRDPSIIISKNPDGTLSTRPRTGTGTTSGAPADSSTPPQPGEPPQPQPGPASVSDGKLIVGDLTLSADDIRGLMERKSLEDSRRANTPATAADFTLDLPSDFVLPAGSGISEWKWDL